ncbi:MAG: YncE family protein [Gemmatimonadaceae bacterium]|nr:YncE family protein [Gemmatimonadaceae bacterium]
MLQLDTSLAARFAIAAVSPQQQVPLEWNPIDVSFTANGDHAYVTLLDGAKVFEIAMATGAVTDSAMFGRRHHRILVAPDDSRYWVISMRGTIWAVDRASGVVLDSATLGNRILRGLAHHANSDRLAVIGDGDVLLLNASTLDSVQTRTLGGYLSQDVAFSSDGTRLFVAQEDQFRVMALDATTLATRDSVVFRDDSFLPFGMRLSPSGDRLVISSFLTGRVAVVDPGTLRVRTMVRTGGGPRRIAFTPSGDRVFVTNEGGWVDVIK